MHAPTLAYATYGLVLFAVLLAADVVISRRARPASLPRPREPASPP